MLGNENYIAFLRVPFASSGPREHNKCGVYQFWALALRYYFIVFHFVLLRLAYMRAKTNKMCWYIFINKRKKGKRNDENVQICFKDECKQQNLDGRTRAYTNEKKERRIVTWLNIHFHWQNLLKSKILDLTCKMSIWMYTEGSRQDETSHHHWFEYLVRINKIDIATFSAQHHGSKVNCTFLSVSIGCV